MSSRFAIIRFVRATFGLAVLLLACASSMAETTVFVNVNVVPMDSERILPQQTVVIVDGLIQTLGSVDSVAVPKGAAVIDGTDRFLMPGLAEMHAHVTDTGPPAFDRLATLFVANGVTTIRGMLGRESHLELREQLADGRVFGPRLITSGPSLNGRSVAGAADAARQVREQKAAGYDFIKVHPGLSRDEFVSLAMAANEIGIPYAGHVPVAAGIELALQYRMATIDHLDGYFAALLPAKSTGSGGFGGLFDTMLADELDAGRLPEIVAATRDAGVWNVPTEVLVEQMIDAKPTAELRSRPEMRFVPVSTVNNWVAGKDAQLEERGFSPVTAANAVEIRRSIILALHRAGAGLLLGSDAPQTFNVPGFSVHRELEALTAAGLSPYDALRSGTAAVAEFLNSNGGVIAEGKDADLLLLNANPLADIRNSRRLHGVMLRGRWLPMAELEARLSQYEVAQGQ